MFRRIAAAEITRHLTRAGHTHSSATDTWQPGHRAQQASPTTIRIHHDGPDEADHLDRYVHTLRALGYTVTTEQRAGRRPSIRVTHRGPAE